MKFYPWFCRALGLALAIPMAIAGVEYRIDRWTSEQGLPQNTVRCLLQSKDGYLWIGTGYGLARYDGVRFKDYTSQMMRADPEGIRVMELAEDREGRIWIRTERGLISCRQAEFRHYSIFESPLQGEIYKMLSARRGGLWLGTKDGLKYFRGGEIIRTYPQKEELRGSKCLPMVEDAQGRIWILHETAGWKPQWQRLDPETDELVTLEAILGTTLEGVRAVHEDRSGKLWLSLSEELVSWKAGKVVRYPMPHAPYQAGDLRELKEGREGDLWFRAGLNIIRFQDGRVGTFNHASGLADTDLRCVLVDREGSVWIGTGSGGLNRMSPRSLMTMFSVNARGEKNEVHSVFPSASGRVWLGTGSGLLGWENGSVETITNHLTNIHGRIPGAVMPVWEDRSGVVWAGLAGGGLNQTQGGELAHVPLPGIPRELEWSVRSFLEDRSGQLWIGTDRLGLVCLEERKFKFFKPEDGLLHESVNSVREAPDGSLWIGTWGGVNHWKDGEFRGITTGDGLLANRATVLTVEADGTVWVGTPKGLNRIRGKEIRSVTALQGLIDNMAYSLMDDELGNYWAHGNRGIWRARRADLHAVADGREDSLQSITFGESDGMVSAEGNGESQPNAARTEDGRLWFPTTRGVVVVNPAKVVEDQITPPLVLEQVVVAGEVLYGDESILGTGVGAGAEEGSVSLGVGAVHVIEFRYTANSFLAPEKIRFKYRLEGYDRDWHDGGANRTAFYTNVRPGNYRFQVKAANHHGFWSETGASFAFRVEPRVWQTWPFRVGCGVAALGLIALVQAGRLRWQRRILKLEERQALADERARIARDLHDDLGTALIGLALELDVNRNRGKSVADLPRKLGETAGRVRELAERMREVVWAVNPRCDTIQSLADFLQQQAGQLMRSSDIQVRFEFPEEIPQLLVSSETRHQLALSAREALANVLRHAQATKVVVTLTVQNNILEISVSDDGRGFSPDSITEASPRHGLSNLRARLAGVGGSFQCASTPGRGTTVIFRLPLATSVAATRAAP